MGATLLPHQGFVGHRRHGYLVPLHDDGQPAESYLFAVGRNHAERPDSFDVMEMLAAFVVGFGAPWRNGEDVQVLELDPSAPAALPENVLLRDRIATADWSQPEPEFIPSELVLNTARGMVVVREDVPRLRRAAGVGADGVPGSWYPEGPIWKGARALILVDLDEHNLGWAEAATRSALGDWWIASGQPHTYQLGRLGQAQEWDATAGRFFSPEETRQRLERERADAADRIGARHYRRSALFTPRERKSVTTALRARGRQSERTAGAEWRAARRDGLGDVLADTVPSELADFYQGLALSHAEPERTLKQRFPALLQRLVSSARQKFHDLMADRLLGTARRQRWFNARARRAEPTARSSENVVMGEMERERLLADLNLTSVEMDLVEALEHRIPLPSWAAERNMPLSEARKLLDRLRLRARDITS